MKGPSKGASIRLEPTRQECCLKLEGSQVKNGAVLTERAVSGGTNRVARTAIHVLELAKVQPSSHERRGPTLQGRPQLRARGTR